jgi:hypothetical protein
VKTGQKKNGERFPVAEKRAEKRVRSPNTETAPDPFKHIQVIEVHTTPANQLGKRIGVWIFPGADAANC